MANNKTIIDCILPIIPPNNNNGDDDYNPVDWLQIKDKHDDKVLLKIPYTSIISINDYKTAVYKTYTCFHNSLKQEAVDIIDYIYTKSNSLLLLFNDKSKYNNDTITLNIKTSAYPSFTQLYFICKMLRRFGDLREVEKDENNDQQLRMKYTINRKEIERYNAALPSSSSSSYANMTKKNILVVESTTDNGIKSSSEKKGEIK